MFVTSTFKILLISFCFISTSSFRMQIRTQAKQRFDIIQSFHPSLGFANYTGRQITPQQVFSFINFINSASTYYRDDTKARLDYISDQMNKTYGRNNIGFSVFQQGNETNFDWFIYAFTKSYASVAAGVDKVFQTNSYMFSIQPYYTGRAFVSGVGQKGSGINSTFQTVINNIILSVETGDICDCSGNSANIFSKLNSYSYGLWSIFCTNTASTFYLNAYSHNNRYIYTKPKLCYYGIFDG